MLGTRFLLYADRGLYIANLETGEQHVVVERPVNGGFQSPKCARSVATCFVVRNTDNADIWQITLPEARRD